MAFRYSKTRRAKRTSKPKAKKYRSRSSSSGARTQTLRIEVHGAQAPSAGFPFLKGLGEGAPGVNGIPGLSVAPNSGRRRPLI